MSDFFTPDSTNASGQYVISHDSEEQFLAMEEDKGNFYHLAWTKEPVEAIHYDSPDQAAAIAKRIALSKGRYLTVCEVHLKNGKARLRPVISFGDPDNEIPFKDEVTPQTPAPKVH